MPIGYNGKILHVDLSKGSWHVEEPEEKWYRTYMGGSNFISYYLLQNLKPGTEALSPENILVFACSVVTGAPLSGFNRYTIGAKSPLTGGFAETEAGGFWAPELKFAGFDAVIVRGPRRPSRSSCGSRTGRSRSGTRRASGGSTTGRPSMRSGNRTGGQAHPCGLDRPGRRAPGALRLRAERPRALQRPDRHGRRHGLQEPQGHRGARHPKTADGGPRKGQGDRALAQ